jgi:predicted small secreted protein
LTVTLSGRLLPVLLLTASAGLVACGDTAPGAGADGKVDATPRALAAVVIDHLGGDPRRETGHWSDSNDPLQVEAQVDYGEDPEGGGAGETRTVRVFVADTDGYTKDELAAIECTRLPRDRCEQSTVDGARVVYTWDPGVHEEEPGSFGWTVVRDDEVVHVGYEPSGYYTKDPRTQALWFDPDDLRAAALDPAMSLRTTTAAYDAGQALEDYEGVEHAPEKPDVVPTTSEQLADRLLEYIGGTPSRVTPSTLSDFGPHAVGAHLVFPARGRFAAYDVDVLTVAGRAPMLDPPPCKASEELVEDPTITCYGYSDDSGYTWTLAKGGKPGVIWYYAAQDDDTFNRVESVGVRISSKAIDASPLMSETHYPLPDGIYAAGDFTGDLRVGPETRTAN